MDRPIHELKAFKKIRLDPGECNIATLEIDKMDLAYYDIDCCSFVFEPGEYEIQAAASSRDIRLVKKINLSE